MGRPTTQPRPPPLLSPHDYIHDSIYKSIVNLPRPSPTPTPAPGSNTTGTGPSSAAASTAACAQDAISYLVDCMEAAWWLLKMSSAPAPAGPRPAPARCWGRRRLGGSLRRARRPGPRDESDYHFRKTATEYDRKPGINRLSCTAK